MLKKYVIYSKIRENTLQNLLMDHGDHFASYITDHDEYSEVKQGHVREHSKPVEHTSNQYKAMPDRVVQVVVSYKEGNTSRISHPPKHQQVQGL